ncbi:hypothetical protein Tco_0380287, partial [Tanacetum coccineum]
TNGYVYSTLISKSKVRQSRSKAIVSKVSTSSSTSAVSSDVAELKDMVRALILDKKNQNPAPAPVKAVEQSCNTSRKLPQQISTKEIPVTVSHRWQTKSESLEPEPKPKPWEWL